MTNHNNDTDHDNNRQSSNQNSDNQSMTNQNSNPETSQKTQDEVTSHNHHNDSQQNNQTTHSDNQQHLGQSAKQRSKPKQNCQNKKHCQGNQNSQNANHREPEHNLQNASSNTSYHPSQELFDALGVTISPELLVTALTHKSFSHENPGAPNYERLEFLGDAVLELVVTETLYKEWSQYDEGHMSKIRSNVVDEGSLAQAARDKLNLGKYLLLGQGERVTNGADKDSILSDVFEALIGATYVEYGFERAKALVHHLVDEDLYATAKLGPSLDWKTSLTIKAHELGFDEPQYQMSVEGPDNAPVFIAKATIANVVDDDHQSIILGSAKASTKRKAQVKAAQLAFVALTKMYGTSEVNNSVAL